MKTNTKREFIPVKSSPEKRGGIATSLSAAFFMKPLIFLPMHRFCGIRSWAVCSLYSICNKRDHAQRELQATVIHVYLGFFHVGATVPGCTAFSLLF